MPSYLITGVSRGIGYEFLRQYSEDSNNTIVGVVRNKAATDEKISGDANLKGRANIHILEADLTKYDALQQAVADAARITGGSLDYLIANAGLVTAFDAFDPIGVLGNKAEELTKNMKELMDINVIANIHLFNLSIPLLLKGQAKKVIVLTTGFADAEVTNQYDLTPAALYAASKAAMNLIVAKFSAQYKQDGVLFLALSPGMVEVGHEHYAKATPEQMQALGAMLGKFAQYAPDFKGPSPPEVAVKAMMSVITNASIEKGHGGGVLSHRGDKIYL